ncbi:MAG: double-strand break repair protein AddB [Sphingomicrobium sp.]
MAERSSTDPAVFTIAANHAFADSLAAGLIERFGGDPLALAGGRILLPNNRAVRAMTDAFVRQSGAGLLLPRLIPIGDPEIEERIGGALDLADEGEPVAPAIDPTERLFTLAAILGREGIGSAEALRLAADLARALDALRIEDISPARLAGAVDETSDLAMHWEKSLAKLELITRAWPQILAQRGRIDLTERRNLLLRRTAARWQSKPPTGFTVAAGITTAAPAVAELLAAVARMAGGEVVVPGLWLDDVMPKAEWDWLGPREDGHGEPNHPQFQAKMLLDRMGVNRDGVRNWPGVAGASSPPQRALAVANAMAAPRFSDKWETLAPAGRRLEGVRLAEFPDVAAEAQGISLVLRQALETPGRTAALITPDRGLATRVSALLERWGIEADDSAGEPLSHTPAATLILAIAGAAAEDLAPVALLSLLKHPLVGGESDARLKWLDHVRALDKNLRGPRPAAGLAGLDRYFAEQDRAKRVGRDWAVVRPLAAALDGLLAVPVPLATLAQSLADLAGQLASERAWRGSAGRMVADMLAAWQAESAARDLIVTANDALPLLRSLFGSQALRPPYGKHPRIFIWGLLEARLQRADLVILGGLNEGTWPGQSTPDPWLPPKVRATLGMPTLESRVGLSAQDFASALGAPDVIVTRARREGRSPTVASRFWLRLKAIDPDIAVDRGLADLARVLDAPDAVRPADRPEPCPPAAVRPTKISVTAVDRLRADPYSFYAEKILLLRAWDPLDADATAAWKGTAVHDVLDAWFRQDGCAAGTLAPRIDAMLADEALHPLVRALWRPRLAEAIGSVEGTVEADRALGREPARSEIPGEAIIAGVTLNGKADRVDSLGDRGVAIIDYKTGQAPSKPVIAAGYALQLGLLGLIARQGGFGLACSRPKSFEYWSLAKDKGQFGYRRDAGAESGQADFLDWTQALFERAAGDWLTGTRGFKAKLNPGRSIHGNYDQLMRLDEWYANAD